MKVLLTATPPFESSTGTDKILYIIDFKKIL